MMSHGGRARRSLAGIDFAVADSRGVITAARLLILDLRVAMAQEGAPRCRAFRVGLTLVIATDMTSL